MSKGNRMSDELIGKALSQEIIQEKLKDAPTRHPPRSSPRRPPPDPLATELKTEKEKRTVTKIKEEFCARQNNFKDELQGLLANIPGAITQTIFKELVDTVLKDGITFSAIVRFFLLVGMLALKWVRQGKGSFVHIIEDILKWTEDYFRDNLLSWIQEQGGWLKCLSSE